MKRAIFVPFFLLFGVAAVHAECYGAANLQTCYDPNNGNSYSVQRIGSQTYVQGSSSTTGSNWSQTSTQVGNSTYTTGVDAHGRPWNETTTRIGHTTVSSGMKANGEPFSASSYDADDDD